VARSHRLLSSRQEAHQVDPASVRRHHSHALACRGSRSSRQRGREAGRYRLCAADCCKAAVAGGKNRQEEAGAPPASPLTATPAQTGCTPPT
jgi:hypothetical protein